MGRNAKVDKTIRVNIHLHSEVAAQLSLACADTSFGGMKYGEQTRIVNEALRSYFKQNESSNKSSDNQIAKGE
jgi:hypothetical protein